MGRSTGRIHNKGETDITATDRLFGFAGMLVLFLRRTLMLGDL